MQCKVSLIIPVYNCERYLVDCFDSIERQSYQHLEVIVINDGSTDNGIDIIKQYIKKNKNWKLIDQDNQGLSKSRNNGVSIATGKYVFFLDSDDYIPDNAIERLVYKAEEQNSDIVIGNMVNYNSTHYFPNYTSKYIRDMDCVEYSKFPNIFSFIHAAGKLYKREKIQHLNFIPNVKHEDNYFNMSLYLSDSKISMISSDVYYHRVREGESKSITQNLNYDTFKDLLINYDRVISENSINSSVNIILSKKIINYIYKNIDSKDRKSAKEDSIRIFGKMDDLNHYPIVLRLFIHLYRKIYEFIISIAVKIRSF